MSNTIPQELCKINTMILPQEAMKCFAEPVKTQDAVLMEIIKANANTEYGRKYNFESITSREDYTKKVPLSTWDDYKEYSNRMLEGEENILFEGVPQYFIMTSGTTGKNKYIPESAAGAAGKSVITALRNVIEISTYMKKEGVANLDFANIGHVLTLSSSGTTGVTKTGVPIGFASGITSNQVEDQLSKLLCYPPQILNLEDNNAIDYLIMRFSLMHADVLGVVGNNAARLKVLMQHAKNNAQMLIDDILNGTISINLPEELHEELTAQLPPNKERATELQKILDSGKDNFILKNYWKKLSLGVFWLGGSVGVYVKEMIPFLPDNITFFDIGYGASELKMNVVTKPGTPYGAVCVFIGFFEFIPQNGGEPVFIDSLQDGEVYEIVVTTYSGLYRYKMGDYIRVEGKTLNTPNIMFISKTGDTASLANEKMSGQAVCNAIQKAVESKNNFLVFCQVFPNAQDKRYHCFLEIKNNVDASAFSETIDKFLMEEGASYKRRRKEKMINSPQIYIMKKGWQEFLYKEKLSPGVSIAQIKLPVIISEFPKDEWMKID